MVNLASPPNAHERWLLLHGTPLTPEVREPLLSFFPPGDLVIRPDITPAPEPGDVNAGLVERVRSSIGTGSGPLHIVGHSFGGQVALDVVLTAPDQVRSLTILCSRDSPYPPFAAAAAALQAGTATDREASLARWFRPAELAAGGPVVDYARRCLTQADPVSWAKALASIAAFDRTTRDVGLAVPATLIAAEFDQVSPPAVMQAFAERLPNGHLHVVAGAAHISPFLDPATLASLLIAASQRAAPPAHQR